MDIKNPIPYDEQLNSRQAAFLKFYADPTSETYMNAKKSALKAGYAKTYAEQIVSSAPWLSKTISKASLMRKAKVVLDDSLTFKDKSNPVGAAKIRFDAAKFIASSDEEFSAKSEQRIEHDVTQNAFEKIGELLEKYK